MGSANDNIVQALTRLFDRKRIVFWYDAGQELRDDYEALSLEGVEKLELSNDEFGIKYRILREQPQQKFLLYRAGPQPPDADNWLLDVQLAHGEFRTDQVALWLAELELGSEFTEMARTHAPFFQHGKRRESLRKRLKADDTARLIRLKMLAVCAGSEARVDAVMEILLQELADERKEKIKLIGRCNLDGFLYEQLARYYGYESDTPGIRDFAVELFKSCYAMGAGGEVKLNGDALVFLKRWKNNRQFEDHFASLSKECARVLGIEHDLTQRDFRELMELDYFRLIDLKIINELVQAVAQRTVTSDDVSGWVRQRRQSHWYVDYSHLYEAIDYAARFMHVLGEASLTMDNLADGVQRYHGSWYRIDQLYRKFVFHVRKSGQASLMEDLAEQVENLYSNNYLLKLNDRFQSCVNGVSEWAAPPVSRQKEFFERWVRPYLRKGNKVCVIISDAMRYEVGEELFCLIRQQDRYRAELEPALAMLPTYTQLGMAALLPNKELAIVDDHSSAVLLDGQSSQGTANRQRLLEQALGRRARACKADELMGMNKDDRRALARDHDVIYVYHNRIDATGDKRESEERVFEAVEDTLQELLLLIRKLAGDNYISNLLVTADHGFIYQHQAIDESDFSGVDAAGDQVLVRNRRFVLGKGLVGSPGLHKFTPEQLGLTGEVEVQLPKSINRLRLKGSGSRFVHGGASLQEAVIPVISINKKRQSDVSAVEVDILSGASQVITAGQLAVALYQAEPVTAKVRPRTLRAGIYTETGDLISDTHDLTFDLNSDNPRDRELQVRFVLTREADAANGKEVILRLEERHAGTSHYREYKSLRYMMRRSFTSDFDL